MGSMKEFMEKRKAKAKHEDVILTARFEVGGGPIEPDKPKPAKPKADKKPTSEVITYACGHTIGRAHIEGSKCRACGADDRKAANFRRRERRKAKRAAKQQAHPQEGRLPDGAIFNVHYDAGQIQWTGILHIAQEPGAPLIFTDTARGVFKLLCKLDRQYREWVKGKRS